jgi:hypothetical protein
MIAPGGSPPGIVDTGIDAPMSRPQLQPGAPPLMTPADGTPSKPLTIGVEPQVEPHVGVQHVVGGQQAAEFELEPHPHRPNRPLRQQVEPVLQELLLLPQRPAHPVCERRQPAANAKAASRLRIMSFTLSKIDGSA